MTDSKPKQEPPYGLRMPLDLKERVRAAAAKNNRSMNAEIVAVLEDKYPEPTVDMESLVRAAQVVVEYIKNGGDPNDAPEEVMASMRDFIHGTQDFETTFEPSPDDPELMRITFAPPSD